jgi:hypothetical protein
MSNPEIEDEAFQCIRCDKELHLNDIFFTLWLNGTESKDYGVHASCLEAHHNAIETTK